MKLTVIMIDPARLLCIGEPVTYRRVTVDLTPEQSEALKRRETGMDRGNPVHEQIGLTFIEE